MPEEQSSLRASGSRDNGVHSAGRVIASPPRDDQLELLGKEVWRVPERAVPLADSSAMGLTKVEGVSPDVSIFTSQITA